MRPIDADRLKETIKKLDVESPDAKTARYSMSDDGFCSFGARMDGDTCD